MFFNTILEQDIYIERDTVYSFSLGKKWEKTNPFSISINNYFDKIFFVNVFFFFLEGCEEFPMKSKQIK